MRRRQFKALWQRLGKLQKRTLSTAIICQVAVEDEGQVHKRERPGVGRKGDRTNKKTATSIVGILAQCGTGEDKVIR